GGPLSVAREPPAKLRPDLRGEHLVRVVAQPDGDRRRHLDLETPSTRFTGVAGGVEPTTAPLNDTVSAAFSALRLVFRACFERCAGAGMLEPSAAASRIGSSDSVRRA